MAALLQRAFREDGYAVDVQASGNEAVWMASECDFDAVILDVGLPDIDGFDVCRQLRERARWMPILMLTAREAVPDLSVPRSASTALTSKVARPAFRRDDHRSCACGSCSS